MAKAAAFQNEGQETPNAHRHYQVTRKDLPLHCPMEGMSVWNSHPRVFLPIEDSGEAMCPYCGAEYTLVDQAV
ncbi:MAG: zinc-finger domain-containing protein [Gammaproteobacteria bacterium]|nr:zinc-finger domain-containing protein [Gammaproteobacteria bacterium]